MDARITLAELVEAVEQQTITATALDRITVAESLAYDLGRLADQLTDHFVQAARAEGHSWAEIGRQLGVSKQGAQQRFVLPATGGGDEIIGQIVELGLPPGGDRPRPGSVRQTVRRVKKALHLHRFDDAARSVVIGAQTEARNLKHAYIGSEHLLLSILGLGAGDPVRNALEALGVDAAATERIKQQLGTGRAEPSGHIPFSKQAKKALELSLRESLRLKHDHIGAEHLLLGLLRGNGRAVELLEDLGITREAAAAAVESAAGVRR